MAKKETQHLLKIKKEEYPQIFNFLENVPRGTKTAHIREALRRYIEDMGDTPHIPSNNAERLDKSSHKQNNSSSVSNNHVQKESFKEKMMRESKDMNNFVPEEDDNELVDLDIDNL